MFKLEQAHSSSAADISTALANSVSSMLGSPFNNKWIITEDEPILCRDVLVFLQNIDIVHPIGQLIRTCCEEFHSSFGCGTKTVIYFIGQWINLCCNLKFQGIPISNILLLLKESLKDCIAFLDCLAIPTHEFLANSKETESRKNEIFDPGSSELTLNDPGNDDILQSDKKTTQNETKNLDVENLDVENLDVEDEDISWFLNETDQEISPVAILDRRSSKAGFYDSEKGSCKNPAYLNNSALIPPIDPSKSSSSFDADEDFDCCFDYFNANDTSRCEKIVRIPSEESNSEKSASNTPSSVLPSESLAEKKFKMDDFSLYLNTKCQQFQNQALSSTVWSSRHLSSSSCEQGLLDSTKHGNRDILKPCFRKTSGIETERKNIQTVQQKTSKTHRTMDSSLDHSTKLDSGIKSSGTEVTQKYLSEFQTENVCVMPEITETEINGDHFSVPVINIKEFRNNEFSEILMQSGDSVTKDFHNSQDVSEGIPSKSLESLVHGLCHGSNEFIEDFLIEAFRHQHRTKTEKNKSLRLRIDLLHVCCIQGLCLSSSHFVPGVVLSIEEKKLHFWDLTETKNLSHSILLVKTSVTHNTHHIGYQKLAKVKNTWTKEEFIVSGETSAKNKWINQVLWILKKLEVTILVAVGKVDEDLQEVLNCNRILVFENTEQSAVEALTTLHRNARTEPVVYITDATQKNILAGLFAEPLNVDRILTSNQHQQFYIVLSTPQCQAQTLVLHHPAKAGLDLLAQEFWLCSHRVSSALSHGKVLPGGGSTEKKCADYLLKKTDIVKESHRNSNGFELYRAEIILKLSQSFQSFAKCVALNSGNPDLVTDHNLILDDHFSKIQAWKTALQLVSILSRIDTQIVLGIPQ